MAVPRNIVFIFSALLSYSSFIGCFSFGNTGVDRELSESVANYLRQRSELMHKDNEERTGQKLTLSPIEQNANAILMKLKRAEIDQQLATEDAVAAGYFLTEKERIENSPVFKIIKKMPKGAVLHLHRESMASYMWLIQQFTTKDICYMCYNSSSLLIEFKISASMPNGTRHCTWKTCPAARADSGDAKKFDLELFDNLTLTSKDNRSRYPTQQLLWKKFGSIFGIIDPLIGYDKAFSAYFEQGLQELLDDNVQYTEVRSLLGSVRDLQGNKYSPSKFVKTLRTTAKEFTTKHSADFFCPKVILIEVRAFDKDAIAATMRATMQLMKEYPDFVAGFDLVGQEDAGHPLVYFIEELLAPSKSGVNLPYFFHAGETNWQGTSIDENLADALLLNTTRIGHGFSLVKHPELLKLVKQRDIAVEVCPISNQILGLVSDFRNHPATDFLSTSVPMTVNNDDPAIWNVTGISYDLFEVFMGMTREGDDLRLLKQLAIDSIKHTALSDEDKNSVMAIWSRKWMEFIKETVQLFS